MDDGPRNWPLRRLFDALLLLPLQCIALGSEKSVIPDPSSVSLAQSRGGRSLTHRGSSCLGGCSINLLHNGLPTRRGASRNHDQPVGRYSTRATCRCRLEDRSSAVHQQMHSLRSTASNSFHQSPAYARQAATATPHY
ncbi:hypothetical protein EDB81DRAFT_798158 [Dactylonectria macrodidyma]|uniref:Secreted protein n=1 Tax=Dactylonectria macrodidyma TaxID=307937 RepID=A0A9P9J268_9HYPO|nr:hypothetical protein EDB81DRAFT_798158 [Dactylonectria macrodidyma]